MLFARTLRLCSAMFAVALLVLLFALPWMRDAGAATVGDFAPTLSPDAADARVAAAPRPTAVDIPAVSFPQTGYRVTNRYGFLDYWRANGQMLLFGYPLSGEVDENGRLVQYFERARLEYHPELAGTSHAIQLGLLGREATVGRSFDPAAPRKNARFFPETAHNIYDKFQRYWEKRGGLARFGYPISEEMDEVATDGVARRVQYFERARFIYYPERMDSFYHAVEARRSLLLATLHEVELDDLGRQVLGTRSFTAPSVQAFGDAPAWSPALWPHRIVVDLSQQQLYAYEGDLLVYQAPVATGRNGFETPSGDFAIYDKLREQRMRSSSGGESWDVPRVPWVMYFHGGVALHGTYWHDRFGTGYRLSHGCVNLNLDDAQWLYGWADVGTSVAVRR